MADRATGINPAMLRWAREQAGFSSVEQVATRMKRAQSEIEAWESGTEFPTWRQLERLARDYYHRPTALFFFPVPPEEQSISAEFRRLPESALQGLDPDTWLAVRQARARQLDLEELAPYDDSSERQILRDLAGSARRSNAESLALLVRRYLSISVDEQLSWKSIDSALENWRNALQAAGIWVFKRRFKQKDIAGFCIYDQDRPLVYLNNGQPKVRQTFTLFHELGHLFFEFNHLERSDVAHYMDTLEGKEKEIEITCNRFAGELLVPTNQFREYAGPIVAAGLSDAVLNQLSRRYRVSREVALRKCLNQNWINQQFHNEKVREWANQTYNSSNSGGGGDYYATQGTYLGTKYTALAFRGYYQGAYDIDQLSEYLNIKTSNVAGLEAWLNSKVPAQ